VIHRSSFRRVIRQWTLAAACGVSLAFATVGCDKKPDPNQNQSQNPAAGGNAAANKSIAILDPTKMMNQLGWGTQKQSAAESFKTEIERQVKVFGGNVEKVVTDERKKIIDAAKLNSDQAKLLNEGQLDKLNLSKDQREEYILVLSRVNQMNQQLNQLLYNVSQRWEAEVGQMFTDQAKPSARKVAQAQGYQVVLLSNQVFHYDNVIDLTDKIVDDLREHPPQLHFPSAPDLKLPNVTLGEMSSAATQPTIPTTPTTKPAK
jgi:Skp family chaperone for outer membrane proteins